MDKVDDKLLTVNDKPSKLPAVNPIKRKSRAGRGIKRVNLNRLEKAGLTVLQREINYLLDKSFTGKLNKDDSISLRDYLRTIRDLKRDEDSQLSKLSDEDLDKLANSVKKKADLV